MGESKSTPHQDAADLEKLPHENPTIGILLCADKNDSMVKTSLPADYQTIATSKYRLYLLTQQQLLAEMRKEIDKHT